MQNEVSKISSEIILSHMRGSEFEKEKLEYQQALKDVEAGIVLELDEDYWKNIDKYIEK